MAETLDSTNTAPPRGDQRDSGGVDGSRRSARRPSGFRPDVEGLRALAVLAVLLYHAGVPWASGGYVGVDVFLVISGYLITRMLLREVEQTGSIAIGTFYARRIRRLLPSAVTVLVAVAALSVALMPSVERLKVARDVVASGFYVVNWRLAGQSVDYFEVGLSGSPVQHFWSLAVEEQFYLIWPALLLGVVWWARRHGRVGPGLRRPLTVALALVATASFVYGVYATLARPDAAYFSTVVRGWELAVGGLIALLLARAPSGEDRALPRPALTVAAVLGWSGVLAIGWAVVRLNDATAFPGFAALAPVLGTAAVIVAGAMSTSVGPMGLLSRSPTRYVGRISYSLYLWHWPLLVFAGLAWGQLDVWAGLAVVLASAVPAIACYHLIEEPFRRGRIWRPTTGRAYLLGGVSTTTAACAGLIVLALTPATTTAPMDEVSGQPKLHQGPSIQRDADAVRPNPADADEDRGQMYEDGCLVPKAKDVSPDCVYGDPSSPTTVVLFGDSHAMQWFPALNEVAKERHWRLVGLTKSGCPAADATIYLDSLGGGYDNCNTWRASTMQRIIDQEKPDLVMIGGMATYRTASGDGDRLDAETSRKDLLAGYDRTVDRLRKSGAQVTLIHDTPRPGDLRECVAQHLHDLKTCAVERDDALDHATILPQVAEDHPDTNLLDATDELCRDDECPAVIGNALVYRNDDHLTATFVHTMTPWLDRQLPQRLPSQQPSSSASS